FAFRAIKVSMMIGIARHKAVAADTVIGFHALDDVHGKREFCNPRFAIALVLQIELGGRRILDDGFRTEIIDRLDEQMRFLSTHQVHVAHGAARTPWQRRRPDQTRRTIAEQIYCRDRRQVIYARELRELGRWSPAIARLVEIQTDTVASQID